MSATVLSGSSAGGCGSVFRWFVFFVVGAARAAIFAFREGSDLAPVCGEKFVDGELFGVLCEGERERMGSGRKGLAFAGAPTCACAVKGTVDGGWECGNEWEQSTYRHVQELLEFVAGEVASFASVHLEHVLWK